MDGYHRCGAPEHTKYAQQSTIKVGLLQSTLYLARRLLLSVAVRLNGHYHWMLYVPLLSKYRRYYLETLFPCMCTLNPVALGEKPRLVERWMLPVVIISLTRASIIFPFLYNISSIYIPESRLARHLVCIGSIINNGHTTI